MSADNSVEGVNVLAAVWRRILNLCISQLLLGGAFRPTGVGIARSTEIVVEGWVDDKAVVLEEDED